MIIFKRCAFIEILKISKKISNPIFSSEGDFEGGGGRIFVQVFWSGLCESRHQTELIKEKRIDEEGGATETQLVHGSLFSARKAEVKLVELVEGGGVSEPDCRMKAPASAKWSQRQTFGKSCGSELKLDLRALSMSEAGAVLIGRIFGGVQN